MRIGLALIAILGMSAVAHGGMTISGHDSPSYDGGTLLYTWTIVVAADDADTAIYAWTDQDLADGGFQGPQLNQYSYMANWGGSPEVIVDYFHTPDLESWNALGIIEVAYDTHFLFDSSDAITSPVCVPLPEDTLAGGYDPVDPTTWTQTIREDGPGQVTPTPDAGWEVIQQGTGTYLRGDFICTTDNVTSFQFAQIVGKDGDWITLKGKIGAAGIIDPTAHLWIDVDINLSGNNEVAPFLPGDCDKDGNVDPADLTTVGLNWSPSPSGKTWAQGDFDGDGDVDPADLTKVGLNWAPGGYLGLGGAPVPEPGTLALLAIGGVAALWRRRR